MIVEQPLFIANSYSKEHCVKSFAKAFNRCFADYQVILKPGAEEPFYQAPSASNRLAIIFSTKDYFSSALHEIAHWCIAGSKRRKQDDYGYWYEPDGRSEQQQALFYHVEAKPQALEWAFSLAAGIDFRLSLDNLDNQTSEEQQLLFRDKVYEQLVTYFKHGFPARSSKVIQLLSTLYRFNHPIQRPQKSSCLI